MISHFSLVAKTESKTRVPASLRPLAADN